MSYTVIWPFLDAHDGNHLYEVGDSFPRRSMEGEISAARIAELMGNKNPLGKPLIAVEGKVKEAPVAKPVEVEKKVEEEPAAEQTEQTAETSDEVDISKAPYFKLKALATQHGIDPTGKKSAELREELAKVM